MEGGGEESKIETLVFQGKMMVIQMMVVIERWEGVSNLGCVLGAAFQDLPVHVTSERENSDNSQIFDVRKSTDGLLPKMETTRGAVGLDSKPKSHVLTLENLRCLLNFSTEILSRQSYNQDWSLTERSGLEI